MIIEDVDQAPFGARRAGAPPGGATPVRARPRREHPRARRLPALRHRHHRRGPRAGAPPPHRAPIPWRASGPGSRSSPRRRRAAAVLVVARSPRAPPHAGDAQRRAERVQPGAAPPRRAGTQAEARRLEPETSGAESVFSAGGRAPPGGRSRCATCSSGRGGWGVCARASSLLREGVSTSDALPPKLRAAAYEEAADVLCGMLPTGPGRARVLTLVASVWGLSADDATHRDTAYKPSVRAGNGAVAVGRATLPAEAGGSGAGSGSGSSWSNTGHAMRILERVASAVQCVEPVLLVGETGAEKTALVQQLAPHRCPAHGGEPLQPERARIFLEHRPAGR